MKREVEAGRFRVVTDDGRLFVIVEYQEFIPVGTLTSRHEEIPGMKRLATSTGFHVNFIDSTTFEIVETGERVRKV
ncbi:MAG: hypothetical protein Q7T26_07015 [Dehalococcoidia bacterium]|nr:hypothetical protein [Dehalococcoidia bacterium]